MLNLLSLLSDLVWLALARIIVWSAATAGDSLPVLLSLNNHNSRPTLTMYQIQRKGSQEEKSNALDLDQVYVSCAVWKQACLSHC